MKSNRQFNHSQNKLNANHNHEHSGNNWQTPKSIYRMMISKMTFIIQCKRYPVQYAYNQSRLFCGESNTLYNTHVTNPSIICCKKRYHACPTHALQQCTVRYDRHAISSNTNGSSTP
eukprot:440265_1